MLDNAKFVQLFKYILNIFHLGAFGIVHRNSSTGIFGGLKKAYQKQTLLLCSWLTGNIITL